MNLTVRRQRGMTLIELLVAIALGLLLLAGILQVFAASRQSYRVQQNTARMQENALIAVEILQRSVREAGFEPPPTAIVRLSCSSVGAADCALAGSDNVAAGTPNAVTGSDTLVVRVRSDGNMSDCQGIPIDYNVISGADNASGDTSTDSDNIRDGFRVSTAVDSTATPPSLRCGLANGTFTQPLVDDIEDMQILYGLSDSSGTVFVPASALTTTTRWNAVTAVRIQLCARSPDANVVPVADTQTCRMDTNSDGLLSDTDTLRPSATPNDGRLRRVVTTTVTLRNRIR